MYMLKESKAVEQHQEGCPCCVHSERRRFLLKTSMVTAGLILGPDLAKAAARRDRLLMMTNPHTGEKIRTIYWTPTDGYIRESLASVSHFMRDFRQNQVRAVDPALLDIVHAISLNIGKHRKFEVVSGYRSPKTNRMLARRSRNVAKRSYHMRAKAMDFQVKNISSRSLRRIALALKAGGVGYYPGARYIHVDSGKVRTWTYR
ncbi:MAG: Tat pathway signal protein [Gammaproteobacteria bacterium]|nr:MAG: Tat pathway signal protein [Gammaproteobacteria bacterium]